MNGPGTPLLSVVVPISRMAGRLDKLNSWVAEIDDNQIEVILVHDKQDERTGDELAKLLLKLYQKPKILECAVGNPGEARNLGLQDAIGEWVVFWDCDDLPNVAAALTCLKEKARKADLIIGEFTWVSELSRERKDSERLTSQNIDSLISVGLNPGIWRMIFKRSLIGSTVFSPFRMAEDQVFIADVLSKNPKIEFTNVKLYNYYYGDPSHLVSNKIAQLDLLKSFEACISIYKRDLPHRNDFLITVMIKQFITSQKYLPLKYKLLTISSLAKLIIDIRWDMLKSVVFVLSKILQLRKANHGK